MTAPRPRECATYGKVTFQLGVLKEGRTLRASYTVQDYLTPQRLPGEGNGTRTKHQDLCQILTTLTSTHKLLALFLIPLFSTPWKCLKCMGSLGGNKPYRLEICETSKGQRMEPQGYTFQPGKGHRQGGSRGSRDPTFQTCFARSQWDKEKRTRAFAISCGGLPFSSIGSFCVFFSFPCFHWKPWKCLQ